MTYTPITIAARRVLLDAVEALADHRDGLVLVGAQAIYLYTGDADVAIATTTKDSDIALIPVRLPADPTLETAMREGVSPTTVPSSSPANGFHPTTSPLPSNCSFPPASAVAAAVAGRGSRRIRSTPRASYPDWRRQQ